MMCKVLIPKGVVIIIAKQ